MKPNVTLLPLQKPDFFLWWIIPQSMWRREVEFNDSYEFLYRDTSRQIHSFINLLAPSGTRVNGSSWPMFLGWLYTPMGASFIAGTFHDFCYKYGCYLAKDKYGVRVVNIDRKQADFIWKNIYIQSNNPVKVKIFGREISFLRGVEVSANIGYIGLRLIGFIAWKKCNKNRVKHLDALINKMRKSNEIKNI